MLHNIVKSQIEKFAKECRLSWKIHKCWIYSLENKINNP